MTERKIQNALHHSLTRKGVELLCPNYTSAGWWEADLWTMTKAGYAVEYEIKISKADFEKDGEKMPNTWAARMVRQRGGHTPTKHEELAAGSVKGPSRFYFVTPQGLVTAEQIPEWAGWIEVSVARGCIRPSEMKKAPQLHREKVGQKVIDHVKSVFYYRYWNLLHKVYPCTSEPTMQTQAE